jgi:hypothetical protein
VHRDEPVSAMSASTPRIMSRARVTGGCAAMRNFLVPAIVSVLVLVAVLWIKPWTDDYADLED